MRIVIDPRPVFKNGFSVEDRRYISACLGMLVKEKPQTDFCLLTDRKSMAGELLAVGATVIPLPSASSIFPGSRFLAIRNLSKTILGQKADALFTIGTAAVMDFGLPECSWLFGSNLPPFKKHAQYQSVKSWLFTGSPDQKPMLLEKGLASHEKIQPVPLAAEDFPSTLTWTEKENLKVK